MKKQTIRIVAVCLLLINCLMISASALAGDRNGDGRIDMRDWIWHFLFKRDLEKPKTSPRGRGGDTDGTVAFSGDAYGETGATIARHKDSTSTASLMSLEHKSADEWIELSFSEDKTEIDSLIQTTNAYPGDGYISTEFTVYTENSLAINEIVPALANQNDGGIAVAKHIKESEDNQFYLITDLENSLLYLIINGAFIGSREIKIYTDDTEKLSPIRLVPADSWGEYYREEYLLKSLKTTYYPLTSLHSIYNSSAVHSTVDSSSNTLYIHSVLDYNYTGYGDNIVSVVIYDKDWKMLSVVTNPERDATLDIPSNGFWYKVFVWDKNFKPLHNYVFSPLNNSYTEN